MLVRLRIHFLAVEEENDMTKKEKCEKLWKTMKKKVKRSISIKRLLALIMLAGNFEKYLIFMFLEPAIHL